MKRPALIIALQLLLTPYVFAQSGQTPFGEVSINYISMERYDKDPTAEAVVLFDEGKSYFIDTEYGYDIRFTRTKRVKVFNSEGIKYASISIPYYYTREETERIRSIEAYSYNIEDGVIKKSTLDPENIYEEVINDRWKRKKFVIPNVREGSVFEFRYVLESPFKFNLPDWEFQSSIPTILSTYEVSMIPFYEYVYIVQGTNRLDINTSNEGNNVRTSPLLRGDGYTNKGFREMVHTYGMRNVPAFKDESYISSRNDYVIKMDFQLARYFSPTGGTITIVTTWPELITDLYKNSYFGSYINKCGKYAREAIEKLPEPLPADKEERCRMIVEYVKNTYKWDGYYGKYTSRNPRELAEKRSGSSAEINLFLTAMLEEAGLEVYPVILSTRDNGKIKTNYPFESFFNYVIPLIVIDEKKILADGTEPLLPYNRIPTRCINEKGLLIKKGSEDWVVLSDNTVSKEMQIFTITPDTESLTASAQVIVRAGEYEAYSYKNRFADDSVSLAKRMLSNGLTRISQLNTLNYNDPSKSYIINISGESDIEGLEKQIFIKPFLNFPMDKNPLTQTERSYPVDMTYASSVTYFSQIDIPSGYKVSELPANHHYEDGLVNISIEYKTEGDKVTVTGNYTFKKAVYSPGDYSKLRFYLNSIVNIFNKTIALEAV